MKMYSIAVAVNFCHSGTQNVALVWNIFVFGLFFNHTRELMHRDYRAEILAQFSCTGNELQLQCLGHSRGRFLRLKASPREGPDRK